MVPDGPVVAPPRRPPVAVPRHARHVHARVVKVGDAGRGHHFGRDGGTRSRSGNIPPCPLGRPPPTAQPRVVVEDRDSTPDVGGPSPIGGDATVGDAIVPRLPVAVAAVVFQVPRVPIYRWKRLYSHLRFEDPWWVGETCGE